LVGEGGLRHRAKSWGKRRDELSVPLVDDAFLDIRVIDGVFEQLHSRLVPIVLLAVENKHCRVRWELAGFHNVAQRVRVSKWDRHRHHVSRVQLLSNPHVWLEELYRWIPNDDLTACWARAAGNFAVAARVTYSWRQECHITALVLVHETDLSETHVPHTYAHEEQAVA